jgi:hypothetical protein
MTAWPHDEERVYHWDGPLSLTSGGPESCCPPVSPTPGIVS